MSPSHLRAFAFRSPASSGVAVWAGGVLSFLALATTGTTTTTRSGWVSVRV